MAEQVAESTLSALRDNIQRKGKHSYYYAWGGTESALNTKFKPRSLGPVEKPESSEGSRPLKTISSFSFLDGKLRVKVYLSIESSRVLSDEDVELNCSEESVSLLVRDVDGFDMRFSVLQLAQKIVPDQTRVSFKEGRVVLSLKKVHELPWNALY